MGERATFAEVVEYLGEPEVVSLLAADSDTADAISAFYMILRGQKPHSHLLAACERMRAEESETDDA